MGIGSFLAFKVGQFLWISLVSFLSFRLMFEMEAQRAPLLVGILVIGICPFRYFYLESISQEKWIRKDIEKSIDLLREFLIASLIYLIVFIPEWWFTKEIYSLFGQPEIFKTKNYSDIDYHTAKELHKSYGIIIVFLISIIDNWMISEMINKRSKSRNETSST